MTPTNDERTKYIRTRTDVVHDLTINSRDGRYALLLDVYDAGFRAGREHEQHRLAAGTEREATGEPEHDDCICAFSYGYVDTHDDWCHFATSKPAEPKCNCHKPLSTRFLVYGDQRCPVHG